MKNNKWYAIRTIDKEKVNKIIDNWVDFNNYVKGHSAVYKVRRCYKIFRSILTQRQIV